MKKKRMREIYKAAGLLLFVEIVVLIIHSGIVKGISPRIDTFKRYAYAEMDEQTIAPGNVYDRDGKVIVKFEFADGELPYRAEYGSNVREYSQLIGYTGPRTIRLMSEKKPGRIADLDEVIGEREDYRLLCYLDDPAWSEFGLYKSVDGEANPARGYSAHLTVDSGLQTAVYQALCSEMTDGETMGSAVVLDAKTGEILSMVALPTYDYRDLQNAKAQMFSDGNEKNLEAYFPLSYKNPIVPGSIFKVLTAAAMLEHGQEDFSVENSNYTVDGWVCAAHEYYADDMKVSYGDRLNMETALKMSSNVYFTRAASELGKEKLDETAAKFMLFETDALQEKEEKESDKEDSADKADDDGNAVEQGLTFDFGFVPYSWHVDEGGEKLAQTGMGQGNTKITSLQEAMIMQAIANHGTMMKPFLISKMVDEKGATRYEGSPEILSEAVGRETAARIAGWLQEAAESNAGLHTLSDTKEVFHRYKVAGKTGTGETEVVKGDRKAEEEVKTENTNSAWFASFAPADDPQYVVVVNQHKTEKFGWRMTPVAAQIYEYLFEEYK